MRHFHLDFGEFKVLMGVVGSRIREVFITAGAAPRLQMFSRAWFQHDLSMIFVTLLASRLSRTPLLRSVLEGGVGLTGGFKDLPRSDLARSSSD